MVSSPTMRQCGVAAMLGLGYFVMCEEKMVPDLDDDSNTRSSKNIFNFASQAAGAVVLDKSPATAKGYSHLLNDDKDKYGISACDEKKWVVIGLSEDILVTSIALANYEKYSSMLKEFQLLASTSYPTEKWINLGIYEAQPRLGMQTFNVSDSSVHTRYLKVKFNTHHGTEDLCTLSQIKVHGTTVIASFKQEVERSDQHMRDLINHLNGDDVTAIIDSNTTQSVMHQGNEAAGEVDVNTDILTEDLEKSTNSIEVDEIGSNSQTKLEEAASVVLTAVGDKIGSNSSAPVTNESSSGEFITATSGAVALNSTIPSINDSSTASAVSESLVELKIAPGGNATVEGIPEMSADSTATNTTTKTTTSTTSTSSPSLSPVSGERDESNVASVLQIDVEGLSSESCSQTNSTALSGGKTEGSAGVLKDMKTAGNISESPVPASINKIPAVEIPDVVLAVGEGNSSKGVDTVKGDPLKTGNTSLTANIATPTVTTTADLKSIVSLGALKDSTDKSTEVLSNGTSITGVAQSAALITQTVKPDKPVENAEGDNLSKTQTPLSNGSKATSAATPVNSTTAATTSASGPHNSTSTDIASTGQIKVAPALSVEIKTSNSSNSSDITMSESPLPQSVPVQVAVTELPSKTSTTSDPAGVTSTSSSIATPTTASANTVSTPLEEDVEGQVGKGSSHLLSGKEEAALGGNGMIFEPTVLPPLSPQGLGTGYVRIVNGPTVIYSPQCLETIRFADFQAMMANKLKQRADSDKSQVPLHSQDNVFRQLMLKIKTLEMNYAIIEMYSAQVSECYRSALHEIYFNMSRNQNQFNSSGESTRSTKASQIATKDTAGVKIHDGEVFVIPPGDGVLKVKISGMGSSASLTAIDVGDADCLYPRVNTRNGSSAVVVVPCMTSCKGSKLSLLSVGLGNALGASQSPATACVCHPKKGCSGPEDFTAFSPVPPAKLLVLGDMDEGTRAIDSSPTGKGIQSVDIPLLDRDSRLILISRGESEDADVIAVESGMATASEKIKIKAVVQDNSSRQCREPVQLDIAKGLTENEVLLVVGVSLCVALLSLCLSLGMCIMLCYSARERSSALR